jgi:hypothetical protein
VTVRQCPRCELRFSNESELESHLVSDHGVDPEDLPDPLHYPRHRDEEEEDGSATAT